MQFSKFYSKLKKDAAKSYGFKSIKEAKAQGINCVRLNFTVDELKDILNIDYSKAMDLIYEWKDENIGIFSRCCGLYTFYIREYRK